MIPNGVILLTEGLASLLLFVVISGWFMNRKR